ncbi:MAG: Hsp33 family molecular chaperone HslO [Armatimonadota bacterium]|nr:Hsp33 family molecular chaperone HslO [Armatimonadota bacterium]MDR7570477.1 Hsp33 family molecular chaperone HslO [Armatimonadota bacterium]MDR7614331.1 Hsp33 family molecular chaperone HslO [Armatimonadota bacterium]
MDTLVRALGADGSVRAFASVTTRLVEEARLRHGTAPTATAALGRALTASGLLAGTLKHGQKVTLRILGDGPLGGILADGTAEGAVRGYVQNPHVHLPLRRPRKLDVGAAVGRGTLHVTRDLGLRYPYHGSAPLVSGEIGEDLAYYFAQSEQIPSVVALGVLVEADGRVVAAGGFLVQVLPRAPEQVLAYLDAHARALPPVTALVRQGLRPAEILQVALGDLPFQVLEERPLRFRCTCSTERVREVLASLGPQELTALLEEQGQAEVRCRFCGERYLLDGPALRDLLRSFA